MRSGSTATAIPIALRVAVLASAEIGWASPKENTTTSTPISMVPVVLSNGSVSQYTPSLRISRCSSHGRKITFSASVSAAEKYR